MSTLIPFGIRNEKILHISEVDRGRDCGCQCLGCGCHLVARKGVFREHHFAHDSNVKNLSCNGGGESLLHQYAKRIIEEAGYLVVPQFSASLPPPHHDQNVLIPSETIKFNRVEVEDSMAIKGRRIDVVGYHEKGRLLIEIVVNHRVKGEKLYQVRAAEEALLEIVLPKHLLFSSEKEGPNSLKSSIIDINDYKRWVVHPNGTKALQNLKRSIQDCTNKPQEEVALDAAFSQAPQDLNRSSQTAHFPDRREYSNKVGYLKAIEAFFNAAQYSPSRRSNVFRALRLSGNISDADLELARTNSIYINQDT